MYLNNSLGIKEAAERIGMQDFSDSHIIIDDETNERLEYLGFGGTSEELIVFPGVRKIVTINHPRMAKRLAGKLRRVGLGDYTISYEKIIR